MAVKKIIVDETLLKLKSEAIDLSHEIEEVVDDLIDTAEYYRNSKMGCVGLAANQIGYLVRVFVIKKGHWYEPIINPRVIKKGGRLVKMNESCLSRPNKPPILKARFQRITIEHQDQVEGLKKETFHGFDARVVQHEIDHFDGILI